MTDYSPFLINTGRTLAQMALYTAEHPSVKGAIQESWRLLSTILEEQPEVVLSIHENKLLVNGEPQEKVAEGALRPFVVLLAAYNLHSLSFLKGLTLDEMSAFFNLASRSEAKKITADLAAYFVERKADHIQVNIAKYAKIGEDQTIGGDEGQKEAAGFDGEDPFLKEFQALSLNDLMSRLIEKAIPNPADRTRVMSRALDLVRQGIDEAVKKATAEFSKERTRLTNERERTEEVIGSMAEGVVMVDENGKVLMMNPTAEEIYGVKLGECVGRQLWEGMRSEQMIALAKDISVPSDRPITKEVQIHGGADIKKTLRMSAATVQDPNGRVVGMVSVLSDVTKQRELTRMQNEFMANVTHDLRTPIHALNLAVAAILEGSAGPTTPEQQKMLSLVNRNVERLSRLIDDLLDFSQMESGSMRINPQVIELPAVLRDAVSSLDAWSKTRGITLVYEESKDLMPVYADNDRVLQVVNNLIANAIKFTPSGGRVFVRAKNVKDKGRSMVQVEIEDTGKGISKEDQKRIFDRFVQLKNQEKLDVRGTGLGLSICRAIVDLHKGQLSLMSPPPSKMNGTLFFFTLPSLQKGEGVLQTKPVEAPAAPAPVRRGFWSRIISRFKCLLVATLLFPMVADARPYWGKVRRVLEGDLIQLQDGTRVRYLGVDAPDRGNGHFQESVSANKRWVENKEVKLQYGLQERDAAGTWVAYVFVDGNFVNEELVREGLALVSPLSNEEEYLVDLIKAEREAHAGKRGMWRDTALDPFPVRMQKSRAPGKK